MSNIGYNKLWAEAQSILDEATNSDRHQISSKPTKDKKAIRKQICTLFLKYNLAITKLCECYDQIIHPQKLILIRKVLKLSIIRYLEIKQELVNLDCTEFTNFDNILSNMKLLPSDIDIQLPDCYWFEEMSVIKWKNDFIDSVLDKISDKELAGDCVIGTEVEKSKISLQSNDNLNVSCKVEPTRDVNCTKVAQFVDKDLTYRKAVIKIQRTWRGFITRQKFKKRVLEEMLLIGMVAPDKYKEDERIQANNIRQQRRQLQEQHIRDFEEAVIREKQYIQKYKSNIIMDSIKDEVRRWYTSYKDHTGKFPDIPSEESGGSAAILKRYSPITVHSETSKSTYRTSGGSTSKTSKSKKPNLQDELSKLSSSDGGSGFKIATSSILSDLISLNTEYEDIWKDLNEDDNPEQTFSLTMVQAEKHAEVEAELRKVADAQLREELEELKAALDRDIKGKKGKKGGRKKKPKRSAKKGKKKKDKDLTLDRSVESLFEELVSNGIIKKYPQVQLSSFEGELHNISLDYAEQKIYVPPSLGDVKQAIRDYCILPLGSEMIHQLAPLNRSLLIAGPSGSGKNQLVHAICTEVGAILFDISASNIVGKYPGKTGLIMLIHLINKVSKLLQPAVIYINEAEKTFLKKVPKTDKTDPKRLKKDISKIVKSIGPNDLVMLIGVTNSPFECDQKSLFQTYNKTIMMLKPDYATVYLFWNKILKSYNCNNEKLSIPLLTKLSDGYTVGTILKAVKQLTTKQRILQLGAYPITMEEIIDVLSKYEPVYKEEEEAFLQWYMKTPIGKNKQRSLEMELNLPENNTNSIK